ncbi:MaoC/PaaZ C-terminal domain-containing protein [Desertibacillus haloalkaliphilus]|uniref:MaoC/PaaZ C-terminal domain-containing protein n=1 Tax=Desertibacillus haloalkaliphilus TaxID=1328930 RepID=UPI001C276D3D|nr:MaoC/PaaZ C-terminal domain-containing protein [Desertibacillus haloalkaliphilus]MBU8907967.1 MaoC family dehydratase N-terminal domain-containing protein [Desertibacillus haloalkaliphilus]
MKTLQSDIVEVGFQLPELELPPITRVQLVKYAGASGDFNPLHTVDEFAQKAGLDGVIAHGMLSMGFLGKYVRTLVKENASIERLKVRFSHMAKPGDTLTCQGEVIKVEERGQHKSVQMEIRAVNQEGKTVTAGTSTVLFF